MKNIVTVMNSLLCFSSSFTRLFDLRLESFRGHCDIVLSVNVTVVNGRVSFKVGYRCTSFSFVVSRSSFFLFRVIGVFL